MKRIFICFLGLFICFIIFSFDNQIVANAETETPQLGEAIEEALDRLDLNALDEYLKSLNEGNEQGIKERLLGYIQGGEVEYEDIFGQISEIFFKEIKELLPSFSCIAAIALLCGILSSLHVGVSSDKTLGTTIYLIAFISALIPVFGVISECFLAAKESVATMKSQMELIFPLLLTLLAASGGVVSVSICKPSVAFLSTAMVEIISNLVFPIVVIIISFSMASRISDDFKFGKFIGVFKSVNKWLIGIGLSVFGLFFTVQGITSATYDGIVRRAAKYAIGNGIPIVGGFLSGGFDLAIAGSVLIKNSLGYLGIVLMISAIFQPLLLIVSTNLLLRITAAITSPFAESKISDFLGETADAINYLAAGILFTAFLYFLSIIIIISSSGAFL